MKKVLMCGAAVLAACMALSAAPVICSSGAISLTPGGASPTINCGGLTFSNFQLLNLSGQNGGSLTISSVAFDAATGLVTLSENPNLGSGGHENLLFTITGSLSSAALSVGGTGATVIERDCANPIPTLGALANLCTNAAQTVSAPGLASVIVHSGDANQPVLTTFAQSTTGYVYKDIGVATGGSLTSMQESYGSRAVPEPASALLFGSALAGLALMRRRKQRG